MTRHLHVPRGLATAHPISAVKARGARLWDDQGKEYLDFVGGIGVMNVGHGHPKVLAAVRAQLEQFGHVCFQVVSYQPYLELAQRLDALVGGGKPYKSLLLTSGAEAVENAVKIARAHTNRPAIIAFRGGFHGRTLMGMTLTSSGAAYRQSFGPFAPEVYHGLYPYALRGITTEQALLGLQQLFDIYVRPDRVAAFVVEPQLGEGGFVPAPPKFLQELRRIADQHGIVLVLDEIQTGFGRTGRMFGFQHSDIEPDLVTLAKSLGAGFPLSAVVGKADIMDAPEPGGLGGTYGGSPIACAAALAVLDVFEEEGLVQRAEALGQRLRAGLQRLQAQVPYIAEVRGLGAMLAMELSGENAAAMAQGVIDAARDRGLLLLKCGPDKNVIRFLPPLTATDEDIDRALSILEASL